MLKKYRNRLLEIIRENGFDPKLFHAKETGDDFIVKLRESDFVFLVIGSTSSFHKFKWRFTKFLPSYNATDEQNRFFDPEYLFRYFSMWLEKHVKLYIQEQIMELWYLQMV